MSCAVFHCASAVEVAVEVVLLENEDRRHLGPYLWTPCCCYWLGMEHGTLPAGTILAGGEAFLRPSRRSSIKHSLTSPLTIPLVATSSLAVSKSAWMESTANFRYAVTSAPVYGNPADLGYGRWGLGGRLTWGALSSIQVGVSVMPLKAVTYTLPPLQPSLVSLVNSRHWDSSALYSRPVH
jgi:hypothetical protein